MRGKTNPFPSSEFALLGLLFERPTHGYDLHRLVNDPQGIGMIWGVKMSNLYAQLDKLEKKGFITGIIRPPDSRPAKTEYHITDEGKNIFVEWLKTIVKHPRDFRQEFMLRYFFILKFEPHKAKDFCAMQHQESSTWFANTVQSNQQWVTESGFKKSILEFRVSQIRSMVDWLEWLQAQSPEISKI
ncbi:MAG: PadR family transcriptional regulator [Chloroflexi bacterium]|nr:PadR family transcriptional regulator [Chloroflexota bacterium]